MKRLLLGFLVLGVLGVAYAGSLWQLQSSPTSEVFNGISSSSPDFAIGVANGGRIVHIVDGVASAVASGTTNDLFDVYVASPSLALATGREIVLLWDGSSWSTIENGVADSVYTGTWITPEGDAAFYGLLGTTFDFVFPYHPGAAMQPVFGRTFGGAMLTACGESNDIKIITERGDIFNVDNFLADIEGFDPIHEQSPPLSLTAAWVPQSACIPGVITPLEIFAINATNEFYRFDGTSWSSMGVTVPAGQTLSWLAGSGPGNVVAVGFESNGMGGNDGVIWIYDGTTWTEDTVLPPGTPGLTDVAISENFINEVFADGFETGTVIAAKMRVPGGRVDILAAAEQGRYLSTGDLFPARLVDLSISKRLLTPEPIRVGDRIQFQLVIQNFGPGTAENFRFLDGYLNNIMHVSNDCGMMQFNNQAGWHYWDVRIPSLEAGGVFVCTFEFDVVGPAGESLRNYAAIAEADEHNYRNNRSDVRNVIIQAAE